MTPADELVDVLLELHGEGADFSDVLSLVPPKMAAYLREEAAAGIALDRIGWDLDDPAEEWALSARIMSEGEPVRLEDVGACFGLTRERTRQIQRDALQRLAKRIRPELAADLRAMLLDMEQSRPDVLHGPISDNGVDGLKSARTAPARTKAQKARAVADARRRMHEAARRYKARGEAIKALNALRD